MTSRRETLWPDGKCARRKRLHEPRSGDDGPDLLLREDVPMPGISSVVRNETRWEGRERQLPSQVSHRTKAVELADRGNRTHSE